MEIRFETDNKELKRKYEEAITGLDNNIKKLYGFDDPVLVEGKRYPGIWLECGPHESTIYGVYKPEIAISGHKIFFHHQMKDGYIPITIMEDHIRTWQIQMVVPIASTSLEVYYMTQNSEFLIHAYEVCSKWDNWLSEHRDTRRTGLCEMFCAWDTGHDRSPRLNGFQLDCPGHDPKRYPLEGGFPYLAPDLSATMYGGRIALSKMAQILGKISEMENWLQKAERIRSAILAYCFDPESIFFYDLDKNRKFIKIKGDIITRVFSEHVVDQTMFNQIFDLHILNTNEFWAPYPLPSISMDEPSFVKELPENSWGGASQTLTALRAPRWFEYYGRYSKLTHVMAIWIKAIVRSNGFMQQMNPWTGEFSTSNPYSPAMCVLIDFISRMYGIRYDYEKMLIEWNCRTPDEASQSYYSFETKEGIAEVTRKANISSLKLNGKELFDVKGICRVITDQTGNIKEVIGTDTSTRDISLYFGVGKKVELVLEPDQRHTFR